MTDAVFRYTARTLEGELVRGSLEAPDLDAVLATLRTRALFITNVQRETAITGAFGRTLALGRVKRKALLAFFRSFTTLIRSGVAMRRSLVIAIERTTDKPLREALQSILADVEHGFSLSDAMARRPRAFPPLYVAMIRGGEAGGILDDVLERLAGFLERDAALRKKVQGALTYPIVVLTAALGLVIFLVARIVPMFATMFTSFKVDLPPNTRFLLALGAAMQHLELWFGAIVALIAAGFLLRQFGATPHGAALLDRLRLRIPVVGGMLRKATTARLSRMLGTLLRSGVELAGAIEIVVPVAASPVYAAGLQRVLVSLREGQSLSEPLAETRLFDPLFTALVGVGEETGQLDEMLFKIAEYFESDVEAAVATLGSVIEPVLIVLLGGIVGFIVFSVFMPLYTLVGSVGQ